MSNQSDPSGQHAAITVNVAFDECRGIYVGGAGDATITVRGTAVAYTGLQAGTILPVRATLVATGATATNLVALY